VYIGGVYKFADIPSSRIPNIYDPEARSPIPNPEPRLKIHRAALLGSRRETYNCSGCHPPAPGLVFLPVLPGGGHAAVPVSRYQQPEPEQLFPVSTPAALFTRDSPGDSAAPVTPSLRLWPRTRTIHRVITQIRCWPRWLRVLLVV